MTASTPGKRSNVPAVANGSLGGIAVKRHVLEVELERMMHLVRRVGFRLRRWIRELPEQRVAMTFDRETHTWSPVLVPEVDPITGVTKAVPVMIACIPDADFIENAKWYSKTITDLLREQRERAKLAPGKGGVPLTDEEYEAELEDLAREKLASMTEDEIKALMSGRPIDVGDRDLKPENVQQAGEFPPEWGDDETI